MTAQTSSVVKLNTTKERGVGESLYRLALRRLSHDTLTLIAMAVIVVLVILAILAPVITNDILRVSYTRTDVANAFSPPGTPGHVLGTDDLGRDHLARLLHAGGVSLRIAVTAAILSLIIGVSLGVITGFYSGAVDDFINWIITTLNSIPQLFLLLIVSAVLSPGPESLILILGFLGWTGTTRLVRGETLSIREREYIIAARAMGASDRRIMFGHILPNLISVVIITLSIDIGVLILVESALSFLGVGVKPPTPTWGNMLTNAQTFFNLGGFLVVMPGLLISITVLCLYVIGDGLRDAFDPTTVE